MFYVYIIGNSKPVLYIGVTSDIKKRIWQHKNKEVEGFSSKYNLNKVLFFEEFVNIEDAISSEKSMKNWKREWKLNLIRKDNPSFNDLAKDWY